MFKEIIINLIANETNLKKEEIGKIIEIPPAEELGDYAFPCFSLSKREKKAPYLIAEQLFKNLSSKLPREIEKIETKGSYVNFFINKKILAEKIIKINPNFGKGNQKEKILLEHTSVNPNASPHVGRTRNSIIGDSIYRILDFLGNKVERHYYINDVSKQVAYLALVFKDKDKFGDLLKKYVDISKKAEKNPELEKKAFELLHKFEHKDKKTSELFRKIVSIAVEGQKRIFSSLGIDWDYFDYESAYMEHGKRILEELEKTGKLFKDEMERYVLDQKLTPVMMKMKTPVLVLTRSDGTGLYVLRDLAYTIEKCKKGKNIIVLGEDQKLYFEQLKEALKLLRKPYPEVVHYSFVLLKGIGKMSTRRGEVILLEEFLDYAKKKAKEEINKRKTKGDAMKVAVAAVKYSMLRNENNKNITFDLEESLRFEGDTGPYLQYSYARASSILKKAKNKKSKKVKVKIPELKKQEISLIKKIAEFPDIVENAGKNMSPHSIASYAHELAQLFNEFYHFCPVLKSKEEAFRLKLIDSFRITLKNALHLLGIEVMEEM